MTENNTNDRRPRSLELFAGGGGLALGLHRAGFDHVALVERDDHAATTLKTNAAAWAERGGAALVPWSTGIVHHADVDDVLTGHALADVGDVDLLAGGPPCQPFSFPQAWRVNIAPTSTTATGGPPRSATCASTSPPWSSGRTSSA
jgi:site-specific DNA-cytosine methylase